MPEPALPRAGQVLEGTVYVSGHGGGRGREWPIMPDGKDLHTAVPTGVQGGGPGEGEGGEGIRRPIKAPPDRLPPESPPGGRQALQAVLHLRL